MDDNRAEQSIKLFVIGRKNWLFSNTPRGARTTAIIYSIVEIAKESGLLLHNTFSMRLRPRPNNTRPP